MNIPLRDGDEVVSSTLFQNSIIVVTKFGYVVKLTKGVTHDEWRIQQL